MEFTHRSTATSAAGLVDDGRRFPDTPFPPPMHGDSMQVIRDALLSQLQKDRLRQEIVVAELSKIECAMALRSAAAESAKPADGLISESWKCSSSTSEAAGDQKRLTHDNEGKPQESSEAKKAPSTKWSCAICHVEATSAGTLLQHFSGQKHRANIDALKAKAKAEKTQKAKQCAERPCPPWTCKFCQANCTCQSDLKNHLNGRRHRANIEALLEECKSMARDSAPSQEADSCTSITSQDEEKSASESICGICQVKWSCQSVMEDHVGGKKHRKNFQALQLEANRLRIMQPKMTKKEQATPKWDCSTCQVRCNSESQFQDHCRSTQHMEMGKKALYFCKFCNLQCNSAKMLAQHQAGRKHQAKLRGC